MKNLVEVEPQECHLFDGSAPFDSGKVVIQARVRRIELYRVSVVLQGHIPDLTPSALGVNRWNGNKVLHGDT